MSVETYIVAMGIEKYLDYALKGYIVYNTKSYLNKLIKIFEFMRSDAIISYFPLFPCSNIVR